MLLFLMPQKAFQNPFNSHLQPVFRPCANHISICKPTGKAIYILTGKSTFAMTFYKTKKSLFMIFGLGYFSGLYTIYT